MNRVVVWRPTMGRLATVAAILAHLAFAQGVAPGLAQQGTGPDRGAFYETLDVNVVNVEVFVTDKKGEPVRGLGREDFELLEDGRPVELTNFYAVEGGRPRPDPVETPAELADGAPRELPPPPGEARVPEDQRLHLVVYVDNFNIRPLDRNRTFARLREFLYDTIAPHDRVMLVTYDRSLHIRQPFTSDSSAVARALVEVEKMTGSAEQAAEETRRLRRAIDNANSSAEVSGRVRAHAQEVFNDLRFTVDALRDFIDSLAGLPGRKALLHLSGGLPMTPGEDLYWAMTRKFDDMSLLSMAREFDSARRFQELAALANGERVTFYTIDASGLQMYASGQAENPGSSVDGLDSFVDSVATANLQSSIRYIAERTGGAAIYNVNDIGLGLERVADDLENYYSLGFQPAHGGDRRYHRIEVKTKDPSLAVRHREGYRSKPASQRMADTTLSTLRYGFESNPLEVALDLGPGAPHDGDSYAVPILVRIPLGRIVLVPRETAHEARLEVFVSAMDERGATSEVSRAAVPITIPDADLPAALDKHFTYEARLLMRRGRHRVAVGVRDEIGATASFVTRGLQVGG